MAYGIQNQIGIGKAQVLQGGQSNPMQIAEVYQQQQARKENQKRYDDAKAEQNEFNKIKIIGDALDPRNFNVHVHDKIRDAKLALMQDFKDTPLSDVAFKVQDYAGKIGYMSDQFNSLQKQMSDTRDYYKPYKEINTSAIADMALSDAVTEFKKTGQIDLTRNYFDEALNKNRKLALGSGSTGYIHDTLPDELVDYESEGQDKDGRGGGSMYKYKFKNVPAYYDVKENGRFAAPTVTTKGKEIEIGGQKVMALDDMAWERYKTNPVNHIRVLAEVEDKYGKNIDPETTEALARIEAYKNIDKYKPQPKITDRQFEPRAINVNVSGGGSGNGATTSWDLREYRDVEGGGKDITVPFQGYTVTAIGNQKLLAKNVVYYPDSKTFKVTEYTGRDANGEPTGETTKTVNWKTMRQNIQGLNPGTDMKPFDALINNSITGKSNVVEEVKNEEQPKGNWWNVNKSKTYSVGGKTLTAEQITKGAAKYKMSEADYLKSIGAK